MEYKIPNLPNRPINSNKGTFGKILNISGSKYMSGAAYLSSISALKVGAGYVELLSSDEVLRTVSCLAPEIVLVPVENLVSEINKVDIITIGCGLSLSDSSHKIFNDTINFRANQKLVIDADGLNILSEKPIVFDKNTILTPHVKEASRLLKCNVEDVIYNMQDAAKEISKKYNCVTVLKSHNTIVTDNKNIFINTNPCSALSKAGSGDVLCGMISGFLAQNMPTFDAAILGVILHNKTGILASKDLTQYCVLASDLIRYIPFAIKDYTT